MSHSNNDSIAADFRVFLRIAWLNYQHGYSILTNADRPMMFETMKDICDCIEQTDVFQNIIKDCKIDYSKGLVTQLFPILIRAAPDVDSINYGRFWVILTLLRHIFMSPINNDMCVEYSYLLDVLGDAAEFSLNDWVKLEGGLESICKRCQEKPATNFIFKFVNTSLERLFVQTHT